MHQAGADGKSASLAGCWDAASLLSWHKRVSFIRFNNREAFCPFFIWPHSFLPASLSGPGGFYQLLSVCESQVQAERKEEQFRS